MATVPKQASMILIGGGTDAPGISIQPDGHGGWVVKKIPGWNPEAMAELASALKVVNSAARLKTPGLFEQTMKSVGAFVSSQIAEHAHGGTVVVVQA